MHFAVGAGSRHGIKPGAAGARDDLSYPVVRISVAARRLGRVALVAVCMAVDDKLGAGLVEGVPEGLQRWPVAEGGAEARPVPVGQGAAGRVGAEVGAQPLFLR